MADEDLTFFRDNYSATGPDNYLDEEHRIQELSPIVVRFGIFPYDPRVANDGVATDFVTQRGPNVGNTHRRTHIASQIRRRDLPGASFYHPIQPGVVVPTTDLRSSNPPREEITRSRLTHRTIGDDGPILPQIEETLRRATRSPALTLIAFSDLYGFQPVEVVHPASITIEFCYQREYPSHDRVPLDLRIVRCGIIESFPTHYRTSAILIQTAHSRADNRPVQSIADPALCICCYRRTLIARHTRDSELPDGEYRQLANQFADRLSFRLDQATDPSTVPSGVIPRLNYLNLANSGPFPFVQSPPSFSPTSSDDDGDDDVDNDENEDPGDNTGNDQ